MRGLPPAAKQIRKAAPPYSQWPGAEVSRAIGGRGVARQEAAGEVGKGNLGSQRPNRVHEVGRILQLVCHPYLSVHDYLARSVVHARVQQGLGADEHDSAVV